MSSTVRSLAALAALVVPAPAAAPAQPVSPRSAEQLPVDTSSILPQPPTAADPASQPAVRRALEMLRATNEWTLSQQISICEIPAPPFKEQQRAEEFARRLRALGLQNVRIDAAGNVLGERVGASPRPLVVLSAHLDTVFPEGTDVRVRRTADTLRGPGISDDCRGLAVVLAVARAMRETGIRSPGTIVFAGTVGEEGAGNLRGVRHLVDVELRDRIDYFISIDGGGQGVTSAAVGSIRYKVTFFGPGGHSYGAFGMANPAHALGRAIARLADLQVPASPRTTFNVGVIGGGTSVNSITTEAWMELDMRSASPVELQRLEAAARAALDSAVADERARWPRSNVPLGVRIDTIGVRPAAAQPDTARIVRLAVETGRAVGLVPRTSASSTDANYPMSRGIPAIEMDGGGSGRASHSPDEIYVDGTFGYRGPQWVLRLVLALAVPQR